MFYSSRMNSWSGDQEAAAGMCCDLAPSKKERKDPKIRRAIRAPAALTPHKQGADAGEEAAWSIRLSEVESSQSDGRPGDEDELGFGKWF